MGDRCESSQKSVRSRKQPPGFCVALLVIVEHTDEFGVGGQPGSSEVRASNDQPTFLLGSEQVEFWMKPPGHPDWMKQVSNVCLFGAFAGMPNEELAVNSLICEDGDVWGPTKRVELLQAVLFEKRWIERICAENSVIEGSSPEDLVKVDS